MASNLCLLTHLMSSHGPCFLFAISQILRLKNTHLVFFTVLWKDFQSSRLSDLLYFSKSLLQFSFHQLFECFMTLIIFEFFAHALSTLLVKSLMIFSKWSISDKFDMSRFLIDAITSWMNCSSLLLSLMIDLFLELMFFSTIGIVIVRSTWLEVRHHSG